MHRLPYFQLAEEVIVDSRRCPDMNGPQVIVKRIQMTSTTVDGLRHVPLNNGEWMYQMLSDNPDKARWLMESSLKKMCEGCGQSFSKVIEGIHRGESLDDDPIYTEISTGISIIHKPGTGLSPESMKKLREFWLRRNGNGKA